MLLNTKNTFNSKIFFFTKLANTSEALPKKKNLTLCQWYCVCVYYQEPSTLSQQVHLRGGQSLLMVLITPLHRPFIYRFLQPFISAAGSKYTICLYQYCPHATPDFIEQQRLAQRQECLAFP